jgi:hypothetical protein
MTLHVNYKKRISLFYLEKEKETSLAACLPF